MYVTDFKTPTAIAEALLEDRSVIVPAHRGEGPTGAFISERRYDRSNVGSLISEQRRRQIEDACLRDPTEAGVMLRNSMRTAAAVLAHELFNDWCREKAA